MVVLAMIAIMAILVPIKYLAAGKARDRALQVEEQIASPQSQTASSQLVIGPAQYGRRNSEPGELFWGFNCFIPPDHLASFVFVCWTNGVPVVDPRFSRYVKVGKAGGIDLPFCILTCFRIAESRHDPRHGVAATGLPLAAALALAG